MLHHLHGLFSKTQFGSFCVLVFHLSLLPSCRGQSQLIGQPQPIVAKLGDDIVLPCLLEPATDSAGLTLEWSKPDMRPRFVFVWREKEELLDIKHPSYMGRASMFIDELKHGNISLKISKAKLSDEGRYRCFIPTLKIDTFVDLVVGVVSSPLIRLSGIDTSSSAVMLECESAGWYPEPEVLWLDAEGNIVSAGPTETLRGPDGLYTVNSSVTVDNKHGNTFTCKLRQNKTNLTRETQIHVQDDFFMVQLHPAVFICIGLAVGMFALLLSFVVWKLKNPRKTKKEHKDEIDEGQKLDSEVQSLTGGQSQTGNVPMEDLKKNKTKDKRLATSEVRAQELQQQLQQKEREMTTMKSDMEQREREMTTMKSDMEQREREMTTRKSDMDQREREMTTMKSDMEQKEREMTTMKSDMEQREREMTTMKSDMDQREREMTTMKSDMDQRESKMTTMKSDMDQREREMTTMKSDMDQRERKMTTMKSDMDQREREMTTMKSDMDQRESKMTTMKSDMDQRESKMTTMKSDMDQRERKMTTMKSDMDQRERKMTTMKSDMDQRESKMTTMTSEMDQREREMTTMKSDMEQREREMTTMKSDMDQRERKMTTMKSDMDQRESKMTTMTSEMDQREREMTTMKSDMEQREREMTVFESTMNHLKEENLPLLEEGKSVCSSSPTWTKGIITVDEVDLKGEYVRLRNISAEEKQLLRCQVLIEIDGKNFIRYKFNKQHTLKPGCSVTIWASDSGCQKAGDLVWSHYGAWTYKSSIKVIIKSATGEVMAMREQQIIDP
ncbi:uncharacterized protein LOC143010559 isoform X2 [Genypterus blacodes]|uniref:uncharacterized protein LOC143010559 isoform X2 n=1 Tax=Genypterus blacodes TaxID=154954 RepID=UPI003F75FE07